MVGTLLNLKPVLQIQGEKLDAYAKCRGKKLARKTMIEAIRKDLETRFPQEWADGSMKLADCLLRQPGGGAGLEGRVGGCLSGTGVLDGSAVPQRSLSHRLRCPGGCLLCGGLKNEKELCLLA